jgi:arylsulfatase A-like enzyme
VFRENGYATAGFVANSHYTSKESGLGRGYIRYTDYKRTVLETLKTTTLVRTESVREAIRLVQNTRSLKRAARALLKFKLVVTQRYPDVDRRTAGDVNKEFLEWQASLDRRPFFAFINYFDAHAPYRPPGKFRTMFRSAPPTELDWYDGGIAYIDCELTSLLAVLAERGVLDETILVVTSDHGEQFGEHGKYEHTNSLYAQVTHVPLVIRYPPRIPGGRRINRVVTLQDLAATLVDLSGVAGDRLGGRSLGGLAKGVGGNGNPVVAELEQHSGVAIFAAPETRAIFDDTHHYITADGAPDELYAYKLDPSETNNLASAATQVLARLRAELRRTTSHARYGVRGSK